MIDFSQQDQYKVMHGVLNERQWRLYVATEARRRGTGGISQVAREAGVTRKTIRKGLQEEEAGGLYEQAQRSAQGAGTLDWRNRHPGTRQRDGIFPQSEQERD